MQRMARSVVHRWGTVAVVAGVVLWTAGCSTPPPAAPRSTDWSSPSRSDEAAQRGNDVALMALALLDSRYTWGGKSPVTGLDCSGFVSHVYREAARLDLRGSSAHLAQHSRLVSRQELLPGDLVFFNTLGAPYSHVGVFVGNGQFVHAANERKGVRLDRLDDRYYAARFEGARTLLD